MQALPGAQTTHRHSWQEAIASVRSGEAEAAVLLRPVTVAQIAEWAHGAAADAAQDDLLQPQTPDRDGVPAPRST